MQLISEQVLLADASDITFTNIPQTSKDLVVVFTCRCTRTAADDLRMRLGHGSIDTGANYGNFTYYGGSSTSTVNEATTTAGTWLGVVPGSNETAGYFVSGHAEIIDYANAATSRQIWVKSGYYGITNNYLALGGGTWKNITQAIDQLRIYPPVGPNLLAGSKVALYGRG